MSTISAVKQFFTKFHNLLDKTFLSDLPAYSEKLHKPCPECEGTGSEDGFTVCAVCKGDRFVPKTYAEIHNLKND